MADGKRRATISIPSSLRSVTPFFEEAQQIIGVANEKLNDSQRRVSIYCIDHAFKLLSTIDTKLDSDAKSALDSFVEMRNELAESIQDGDVVPQIPNIREMDMNQPKEKMPPEAILIAEANETLNLADQQLEEGMNAAAARNYHTATIYFRVLESIVPHLSGELHERLEYAAVRTRQCSHLLQNFVHEHFDGVKCSDVYDIFTEKRIGKGSYGSVYYCKHKKTEDEFACKVINVNRINSHYLRKLHLEINIMKEVDHPNIIKLRGVFFGQRTVCLVMELCKGGELFDQLTGSGAQKKGFAEPRAAKMLQDMFSAILYLHNIGIVHRDLKLENFLFEDQSPTSALKLIDFGLSKHFSPQEIMRQVVGSAYYTAPEVLQGTYGPGCDVWSLGVVAYMILSGCPPFFGSNSDAIHDMILTEEPDFSSKRFSHVSAVALDFIQKLLVKDPSQRFTPAQALNHPFIQSAINPMGKPDCGLVESPDDVINSLKSFVEMSRFKKLVLELVAFSLSSGQISQMREEFNIIDSDRSGTISINELQKCFSTMKQTSHNLEEVQQVFDSVDVDNSAEINYNEFVAAAMCRRITLDEEKLMVAFETLDIDNTGFLSKDTIKRTIGGQMTDEEIDQMMLEVDKDGDGRIDYMEFVSYWRDATTKNQLSPMDKLIKSVRKITTGMRAINVMQKTTDAFKSYVADKVEGPAEGQRKSSVVAMKLKGGVKSSSQGKMNVSTIAEEDSKAPSSTSAPNGSSGKSDHKAR